MFEIEVDNRGNSSIASRNPRFHRFFTSPAGSEFVDHMNNTYNTYHDTYNNKHQDYEVNNHTDSHTQANDSTFLEPICNGSDEQDTPTQLETPSASLEAYLFANGNDRIELDAITQLQREHETYIEVLEATHKQQIQAIKKQLDDANLALQNSSKNQELQREVENSLAAMRDEIERTVRSEAVEERRRDKEAMETHFKDAMAKELDMIAKAIKAEAQVQMQAQLQSLKEQIDAQVRSQLQSETEHKVRLALVQQMRPQVRAELEQALRLEIRTVYCQEIRKEVEATIVPETEKRIAAEYRAKYARTQSAQKEQVEAEIQAQLTASKKALEERVRRDAEATITRKVATKVEGEVRVRVEKAKQEIRAECELEAQKLVEASLVQVKQERAEVARLRAVENVRRTREEATHKEAEADFHKKVAEFKRYMQEEESRLARMKAFVQWRDDHPRRPPSGLTSPPEQSMSPSATRASPNSSYGLCDSISSLHKPRTPSLNNPIEIPPTVASPMVSTATPAIATPATSSNSPSKISPSNSSTSNSPSFNPELVQSCKPLATPSKSTGLTFDFTFDVKLIAAKLISDAREHAHDTLNLPNNPQDRSFAENTNHLTSSTSSPVIPRPHNHIRTPSPVYSQSPAPSSTTHTLGSISTEQRAQRDFEAQPPIVAPQGALGARLRVLLPRLYQLWDECEVSHIHRLDFSNGLRTVDVAQVERRVAMEIARLRRLLPTIHQEMSMVARRESIKARLAQETQGSLLAPAEKTSLLAELRRISSVAQAAISAWEAANGQPFMYRGFPYLALMSGS